MIKEEQAHSLSKDISEAVNKSEAKDFLILVPFDSGDSLSYISSSESSGQTQSSMTAYAAARTLITNLMRFNGLSPHAAAGALKVMIDQAADDTVEEIETSKKMMFSGSAQA